MNPVAALSHNMRSPRGYLAAAERPCPVSGILPFENSTKQVDPRHLGAPGT